MIKPIIGSEFPASVIPLIDSAKQSVKIVVFDWRWYPDDPGASPQLFNQAVVRAVKRGVVLRVVCNSFPILPILQGIGAQCRQTLSSTVVHAKMMIIDDKILVIGSHNYTQMAFTKNRELSLICDDIADISPYNKFFETLWLL